MQTDKIGPLNCRVIGNPKQAKLSFILCHGYGAPGTDLVPLAEELISLENSLAESVAFVFPEAPHDLTDQGMPGGRAWWPINMMRLQELMQTNNFQELAESEPPGMSEARGQFREFLSEYQTLSSHKLSEIILGGFSQGAMLTTDATLRLSDSPAGLCIYSGTLLCKKEWQELAPNRAGLPVIQAHGSMDPILPFPMAEELRDLLKNAGLVVNFHPFPGMHTISWDALEMTVEMLKQTLAHSSI